MVDGLKRRINTVFPWMAQVYRAIKNAVVWPICVNRSIFFIRRTERPGHGYAENGANNTEAINGFDSIEKYVKSDEFWSGYFKDKDISERFKAGNYCFAIFEQGKLAGIRWCCTTTCSDLFPPLPMKFDFARYPYFNGLMVHPDFRRRRVASRLYEGSGYYMHLKGFSKETVMVWDKNKIALKAIAGSGFQRCGAVFHIKLFNTINLFIYTGDVLKGKKRYGAVSKD
jgi:GNAT superfamily N-acetyltransferase